MADQQPQKNDSSPSGGGGGKRNNRRYFRRRRNKGGGEGQAAPSQEKEQNRAQPEAKGQGNRSQEQRSEQQERRRKRRRSGNNRRSSSSRRQRRQEQGEQTVQSAPEPERYQEPVEVYVHTHIVRPAYRDAGGEYISDGSFLSGRRPPEASIHMERLQEDIRGQLDEYLTRQPAPVKVNRELGDEDWDDEE